MSVFSGEHRPLACRCRRLAGITCAKERPRRAEEPTFEKPVLANRQNQQARGLCSPERKLRERQIGIDFGRKRRGVSALQVELGGETDHGGVIGAERGRREAQLQTRPLAA